MPVVEGHAQTIYIGIICVVDKSRSYDEYKCTV